eukprot:TRINITY_DN138287_c0_g1_i1.p5 TRINITY_DN138287_c0_g1~~TRINITY_DN138287_c0_g1_i1.p5  ORF type:complete len:183 (+),score=5.95 TRINITY_DN138287_c0_g1_i1:184-732(+)
MKDLAIHLIEATIEFVADGPEIEEIVLGNTLLKFLGEERLLHESLVISREIMEKLENKMGNSKAMDTLGLCKDFIVKRHVDSINISNPGANAIARALEKNVHMERLDMRIWSCAKPLGRNGLGDEGASEIANALLKNFSLLQLSLSILYLIRQICGQHQMKLVSKELKKQRTSYEVLPHSRT